MGKYKAKHKTFESSKKNDKLKEYREEIKTKNELIKQLQKEIKELKKNGYTEQKEEKIKINPNTLKCTKCLSSDVKKLSLGLKGGSMVICSHCGEKEIVK